MKSPHESSTEYSRRLAYWRANAGMTFVVMLCVVAATVFLRTPDFRFIGMCTVTGFALFLSWYLNPAKKPYASLGAAIVGIMIALLGLVAVADWSFPMLFSQGIAVTAGSFSFCMMIWNAKNG
jgi:hypothetical protein